MQSNIDTIKNLYTQRYYEERKAIRGIALRDLPRKEVCVEFYSGIGGMTKVWLSKIAKSITNDKNKKAPSQYHLDAEKFAEKILPRLGRVDVMDFDAYGCPTLTVQKAFEYIDKSSVPFVIVLTDGMGLAMLRGFTKVDYNKFYFWQTRVKKLHLYHPLLTNWFVKKLAERYGWKAEQKGLIQSTNKHFVFSCYLIR